MKRALMLTIAVIAVALPVQAKTRTYANGCGWIRVTTHRSPSYRYGRSYSSYSRYNGYNGYSRYGYYDRSGTTYYDQKEGIYIKRDYTLRDALFGGGDDQVNEVLAISRETREQKDPKLTTQEMNEWVKRIKAAQAEKEKAKALEQQKVLLEEIKRLQEENKKLREQQEKTSPKE